MKLELGIKTIILISLGVIILGGIGGVVLERLILPQLSTWPILRNFSLTSPTAPIVITKREEIHVNEGINNLDVANRVRSSLVTLYLHTGEFGSEKFHLFSIQSGVIMASDGIIVAALPAARPESQVTVVTANNQIKPAKILATDTLTGLTFLKIEASDLSVIKQGFSQDIALGERLLLISLTEASRDVLIGPVTVVRSSTPQAGFDTIYELANFNTFLETDLNLDLKRVGAVAVNRDGLLVGFMTQIGRNVTVLRSEDLKLALDNFLDDGKITWPTAKISYQIFGEEQTSLLHLPKPYGVLVKSGPAPLLVNDFVFAVSGRELSADDGFQELLLARHPGEKVKLKLLRDGVEKEVEIIL